MFLCWIKRERKTTRLSQESLISFPRLLDLGRNKKPTKWNWWVKVIKPLFGRPATGRAVNVLALPALWKPRWKSKFKPSRKRRMETDSLLGNGQKELYKLGWQILKSWNDLSKTNPANKSPNFPEELMALVEEILVQTMRAPDRFYNADSAAVVAFVIAPQVWIRLEKERRQCFSPNFSSQTKIGWGSKRWIRISGYWIEIFMPSTPTPPSIIFL